MESIWVITTQEAYTFGNSTNNLSSSNKFTALRLFMETNRRAPREYPILFMIKFLKEARNSINGQMITKHILNWQPPE